MMKSTDLLSDVKFPLGFTELGWESTNGPLKPKGLYARVTSMREDSIKFSQSQGKRFLSRMGL